MRAPGAAVAAAAFLAAAPSARAQDPVAERQAARADALMERLYADHGNPALLREAGLLLEECLESGNYRTAEYVAGQIRYHRPDSLRDGHLYVRVLAARGERGKAEKELHALLKERPSDSTAAEMLAGLLENEGRFVDAMEVHEARIAERAGDAGALAARAYLALERLRDPVAARREAARMREAASRPEAPAETAAWLRENADRVEKGAARMDGERATLAAAESRVGRVLWGTVLGAVLAFGVAVRSTRRE